MSRVPCGVLSGASSDWVTFTEASLFVDGVSRPGWGAIEYVFPLFDLFFSGVNLDFFCGIFDCYGRIASKK